MISQRIKISCERRQAIVPSVGYALGKLKALTEQAARSVAADVKVIYYCLWMYPHCLATVNVTLSKVIPRLSKV